MQFVDPDALFRLARYGPGNLAISTFAYSPLFGLILDDGKVTHSTLLWKEIDLAAYDAQTAATIERMTDDLRYGEAEFTNANALSGRLCPASVVYEVQPETIGRQLVTRSQIAVPRGFPQEGSREGWVVSFWNYDPEEYERMLADCMIALYDQHVIEDPVYISCSLFGIKLYSAGETRATAQDTTRPDNTEIEKRRRLHLMPPDEKKKAMHDLGLTTQSQKHPMQAAMEKGQYIQPGQKWWAPTSESAFHAKLNKILRERFP